MLKCGCANALAPFFNLIRLSLTTRWHKCPRNCVGYAWTTTAYIVAGLKTCPLDFEDLCSKFTHAEKLLCTCTRYKLNKKAVAHPCICLSRKRDFYLGTECWRRVLFWLVNLPCTVKASKSSRAQVTYNKDFHCKPSLHMGFPCEKQKPTQQDWILPCFNMVL